jgi:hypothetical protein
VQAEKKDKPTARSSTFNFARTSQNQKSFHFPSAPQYNFKYFPVILFIGVFLISNIRQLLLYLA